jgi:hypothetical protein
MTRALILALTLASFATSASAMGPLKAPLPLQTFEQAKIVCEQDGYCYQPRGRRPVARWVYGGDVFRGPFYGPGNYGWPGYHSIWWPFGF